MYYLAKQKGPVPAEAPYSANADERFQWDLHQRKHREALSNIIGTVSKNHPSPAGDPPLLRIQAQTHKFRDDLRKAEIGRENRKLVDRLTHIARGNVQHSGGPPPLMPAGPGVPPGQKVAAAAPSYLGPSGAALAERARSMSDAVRRRHQRVIEQDNAALVQRILGVKSSFNANVDAKDFERHKRASDLLRRLPENKMVRQASRPRSLPPLRPPRPGRESSSCVRGLGELLLPGDLQRSISRQEGEQEAEDVDGSMSPPEERGQSRSAPETAREGAWTWSPGMKESIGKQQACSGPPSPTPAAPSRTTSKGSAQRQPLPSEQGSAREPPQGDGITRVPPQWQAADGRNAGRTREEVGEVSSMWMPRDEATERREWISGDGKHDHASAGGLDHQRKVGVAGASQPFAEMQKEMMAMGVSTDSIKYAEDWDEESFSMDPSRAGSSLSGTRPRMQR